MIVNPNKVPYFHDDGFYFLDGCIISFLRDWSDGDYYIMQFLHEYNLTPESLDKALPEDIRLKIRAKELKLVLGNQQEAFHSIVDACYKIFTQDLQFPAEQIVFLTSSPNIMQAVKAAALKYETVEFKTILARTYEHDVAHKEFYRVKSQPVDYSNKIFNKKFVCLNRRWRPHRAALVGLLHIKDLLKEGYVSLGDCEQGNWDRVYHWVLDCSYNEGFIEQWKSNKESIFNIPPLYVDTETTDRVLDDFRFELRKFYEDTFFSVVTETPFYTTNGFENNIHLSEKTFKVISQRHPFLLVDTPHSLKALRDLGYKTFHPWIDESYDDELDDSLRLMMIVDQIKILCNLGDEQTQKFIEGVREICEYNYQHLISRVDILGGYSTDLN